MNKYLVCPHCQQRLHLGQDKYIYLGERTVMENLTLFLQKHVGHSLVYTSEGRGLIRFEDLPYEEKL